MVIRVKLNCNCVDSNTETNKNEKKIPQIYETKCTNLDNFLTVRGGRRATPATFSGELSSVLRL